MLLARRCPTTATVARRPVALSRLARRSQCSSNSNERRNSARLHPVPGADHKSSLKVSVRQHACHLVSLAVILVVGTALGHSSVANCKRYFPPREQCRRRRNQKRALQVRKPSSPSTDPASTAAPCFRPEPAGPLWLKASEIRAVLAAVMSGVRLQKSS